MIGYRLSIMSCQLITGQKMIGDRLGKWVIFKELGRGGMGRVYLRKRN